MIKVKVRLVSQFEIDVSDIETAVAVAANVSRRDFVPKYQGRVNRSEITAYPGPPAGTFKHKATPKQRRYVMMLIRKGIWTGRTGKLARSWKVSSKRAGDTVRITLENTAENERGQPYSPYVVGSYRQTFHADTGWKVVDNPAYNIMGDMARDIGDVMQRMIIP